MPIVDQSANERKDRLDELAAELLGVDDEELVRDGGDVAFRLLGTNPVRLVVAGGAGAGKSTTARAIAERLSLPVFDFDKYVPGGYSTDAKVYRKRLLDGLTNLFDDLPARRDSGWVVEHAEACSEELVKAFHPTHALLLRPSTTRLLDASRARSRAGEESADTQYRRERRALESSVFALMQFRKLRGKVLARTKTWVLKKLG